MNNLVKLDYGQPCFEPNGYPAILIIVISKAMGNSAFGRIERSEYCYYCLAAALRLFLYSPLAHHRLYATFD